ncbi:M23 family metallopeptidase [Nocardioides jensenii]|uniref:M23 family metallopeptidase n=1 Tax=Nocardioides jensenii TaxID=1843 RepID=UPI0009E6CA01|nr:peptidoglycan DD-metalloendopeptidase family protein [Nocardioides jensenii]
MRIRFLIALVTVIVPLVAGGVVTRSAAASDRPDGVWPLAPRPAVVSGFDPPDTRWGAGHRGVDLAGSPGQLVRSALSGTVSFAGVIAGRSVVVVSHGATRTTYEPVVATIAVGTPVEAGTAIGRLQLGGSHCLPASCLHWGLIRNADDVYLDPLDLVGADRVRLLPFHGLGRERGDAPGTSGPPGGADSGLFPSARPPGSGITGVLRLLRLPETRP